MTDNKPPASGGSKPAKDISEGIQAAKLNFVGMLLAALIGLIGTLITGYFIYQATVWPGKATLTAQALAALFTPTPTPLPSPSTTITASPTASPTATTTPTATPLPIYSPESSTYLKLADFELCQAGMGSTNPGDLENSLNHQCLQIADHTGSVIRLEYTTPSKWAGFWLDLEGVDFSPYDTLTFFSRADTAQALLPWFKLELRRKDGTRLGIFPVGNLSYNWQQFNISLDQFAQFGDTPALCGWGEMTQLIFVFEAARSGPGGALYLDDLYLERRKSGAPMVDPALCNLIVSDFESGTSIHLLGGEMGAACPQKGCPTADSLSVSYANDPGHTNIARLEYHLKTWSAFWMKLNGLDLTPYDHLAFDLRADQNFPTPAKIKLELKQGESLQTAIYYLFGITSHWQTFQVNLSDFKLVDSAAPLASRQGMAELVFTFEADNGNDGIVYLDNVLFTP